MHKYVYNIIRNSQKPKINVYQQQKRLYLHDGILVAIRKNKLPIQAKLQKISQILC